MPRQFARTPDFLQSVPRKARASAASPAPHANAASAQAEPAKTPITCRQHWARIIGGATIASVIAFALAISPGPNPELSNVQKALAQSLKNDDNSFHSATARDETKGRKNAIHAKSKRTGLGA